MLFLCHKLRKIIELWQEHEKWAVAEMKIRSGFFYITEKGVVKLIV